MHRCHLVQHQFLVISHDLDPRKHVWMLKITKNPKTWLQCNLHTNDLSFPKQTFTVLLYILHLPNIEFNLLFWKLHFFYESLWYTNKKNTKKTFNMSCQQFFHMWKTGAPRIWTLLSSSYYTILHRITPRFTQLNRNILLFFIVMIRRAFYFYNKSYYNQNIQMAYFDNKVTKYIKHWCFLFRERDTTANVYCFLWG